MSAFELKVLSVESHAGKGEALAYGEFEEKTDSLVFHRVGSLQGALEALELGEFDLIIADLRLPDCNGCEVFHLIREVAPELPIFIRCTEEDLDEAAGCAQRGAQGYFLREQSGGALALLAYGLKKAREQWNLHFRAIHSERLSTISALAAGVAHSVNNPLSYILYNLESLTNDLSEVSTALREYRRAVELRLGAETADHLTGSAGQLLNEQLFCDIYERCVDTLTGSRRIREIARKLGVLSRTKRDELESVELTQLIEPAVSMIRSQIKSRAKLVTEYGDCSFVTGCKGTLSQGFLFLLLNALHTIEVGDANNNEIRIRTWSEHHRVCAEISDTGKGIGAEDLSNIFEPFGYARDGSEAGIGLSIAGYIFKEQGGCIEVTSEQGKGSTVLVHLPVTLGS